MSVAKTGDMKLASSTIAVSCALLVAGCGKKYPTPDGEQPVSYWTWSDAVPMRGELLHGATMSFKGSASDMKVVVRSRLDKDTWSWWCELEGTVGEGVAPDGAEKPTVFTMKKGRCQSFATTGIDAKCASDIASDVTIEWLPIEGLHTPKLTPIKYFEKGKNGCNGNETFEYLELKASTVKLAPK